MHKILAFLSICLISIGLAAQKVSVSVSPQVVGVGDYVYVTYHVKSHGDCRIQLSESVAGFADIQGPDYSISSSSSMSSGGQYSSSYSTDCTYLMTATKVGTFSVPVAHIYVDGKTLTSPSKSVRVVASSSRSSNSYSHSASMGSDPVSMMQQMEEMLRREQEAMDRVDEWNSPEEDMSRIPADKRLFMKISANKTSVYEQEALVVTCTLYSAYKQIGLASQLDPQFDNFQYAELSNPNITHLEIKKEGGYNYYAGTLYKFLLFPQKSGRLVIPSLSVQLQVADGFSQRTVTASSNTLAIDVKELPAKPANFSGAVGRNFNITSKLDNSHVAVNDAATLKVSVSGVGNLNLMSAPTVNWPEGFDGYDPKSNESINAEEDGYHGSVKYDCAAMPQNQGKFTIPRVEFCYFDLDSHTYKTLYTDSTTISVGPSRGGKGGVGSSDDDPLNNVNKGGFSLLTKSNYLWGTFPYFAVYLVIFVLGLVGLFFIGRRIAATADVVGLRGRRACKAATKRLRVADKCLKQHKTDEFYEEVMRALLFYVSDKLNLDKTELTKDNVSEMMLAKGVDPELCQRYIDVLSECEFARYAPGDPNQTMKKTYNDAFESITQLESTL